MPTALVIAAAGAGTRLGAGLPKALAPLADGRTPVSYTHLTLPTTPYV